jgi:hypothetical protein
VGFFFVAAGALGFALMVELLTLATAISQLIWPSLLIWPSQ